MKRKWESRGGERRKGSVIELACHDLRKGVKGTNLPVTKERLSNMGRKLSRVVGYKTLVYVRLKEVQIIITIIEGFSSFKN